MAGHSHTFQGNSDLLRRYLSANFFTGTYNEDVVKTPSLPYLLILLLGGLVLNSAVAWSFAMWSNLSRNALVEQPAQATWPRPVNNRWPKQDIELTIEYTTGVTSYQAFAIDDRKRRNPVLVLTGYAASISDESRHTLDDRTARLKEIDELLGLLLAGK